MFKITPSYKFSPLNKMLQEKNTKKKISKSYSQTERCAGIQILKEKQFFLQWMNR